MYTPTGFDTFMPSSGNLHLRLDKEQKFSKLQLLKIQAASPGRGLHASYFVFVLIIEGYILIYYYVVHPHTQYKGTMLQQGF